MFREIDGLRQVFTDSTRVILVSGDDSVVVRYVHTTGRVLHPLLVLIVIEVPGDLSLFFLTSTPSNLVTIRLIFHHKFLLAFKLLLYHIVEVFVVYGDLLVLVTDLASPRLLFILERHSLVKSVDRT